MVLRPRPHPLRGRRAPSGPLSGERPAPPGQADSPGSFDRSAAVYDDHVAFNRAGALRLVASIPPGSYPRLLDVACGTGFATLAAISPLGVRSVTGIDASAPMLEVFRERLAAVPGVTADLRASDVLDMGVADASADLVLCTMALHWFTDRPAAVAAMARALAPGGVLGILAPGPGHDRETVARIHATGDPMLRRLADAIEENQVDPRLVAGWIAATGLEAVDVWTETRSRAVSTDSYAARLEAVASHLWSDLPEPDQQDVVARVRALLEASVEDGAYRYRFVKTFAVARAPGGPGAG